MAQGRARNTNPRQSVSDFFLRFCLRKGEVCFSKTIFASDPRKAGAARTLCMLTVLTVLDFSVFI